MTALAAAIPIAPLGNGQASSASTISSYAPPRVPPNSAATQSVAGDQLSVALNQALNASNEGGAAEEGVAAEAEKEDETENGEAADEGKLLLCVFAFSALARYAYSPSGRRIRRNYYINRLI